MNRDLAAAATLNNCFTCRFYLGLACGPFDKPLDGARTDVQRFSLHGTLTAPRSPVTGVAGDWCVVYCLHARPVV
jgi:hypothetical protein